MHMDADQIQAKVLAAFPAPFRRRLAQGVFNAWRAEWERADANYAATERDSVFWWGRRARTEEHLRGAAELVDGLDAETLPIPNTALYYTTVYGGGCKLVAKKVDRPGAMIEQADYRTELAVENPQMSLFPEIDQAPEPEPEEPEEHGLLVVAAISGYIPSINDTERYPYLPGSLYLSCPDDKFKTYVSEWNVFNEFPEIVRANVPNTWDDDAVLRFLHQSQSATYRFGAGA